MNAIEATIALCLIFAVILLNHFLKMRKRKLPPGPIGLPFVGYLPFLNAKNPHISLTELAEKYGRIYSMQMGSIFTGKNDFDLEARLERDSLR